MAERPTSPWLVRVAAAALALLALWVVVGLVQIVVGRAGHPAPFDWSEEGGLYQAQVIADGGWIYGDPAEVGPPSPYPPGHFVVLAAVGKVLGLGFAEGRAVSALCFALAAVLLGHQVARAWGPRLGLVELTAAMVAVGTIAATYTAAGGWYDQIRNDSLALVLVVAGAALCLRAQHSGVAAGLVLAAAVLTKQTMLPYVVVAALWCARYRRAALWPMVATVVATLVTATAVLQVTSDGWFWRQVVATFTGDQVFPRSVVTGLVDLVRGAPLLVAVPVLLRVAWQQGRALSERSVLWLGLLAVSVPAGLSSYIKAGGTANSLIPTLALGGPVAFMLAVDSGLADPARPALRRLAVLVLPALLLPALAADPGRWVPSDAERHDAEVTLDELHRLDGDVFAPSRPFSATRVTPGWRQPHMMGLLDASDLHGASPSEITIPSDPYDAVAPGSIEWWRFRDFVEEVRPRWIVLTTVLDVAGAQAGWIPPGYEQVDVGFDSSVLAYGEGRYQVYRRQGP